ncbi:hypothetical protein GKIL_0979 [Gloeobacter kilaueensis JS1]|uniref:Uncharacterized protein n=1 Tax=Gloeobacter kilaueensis (strain ATCC BAA-2537 / CCAP 1431/1 / ULC 316 / JS1) TaxID=1183438 RepID=U5QHT5_GLOK1|nr:hypothetical protein GKIL_0979 [Gloeobacter kilaueensis JS1]
MEATSYLDNDVCMLNRLSQRSRIPNNYASVGCTYHR